MTTAPRTNTIPDIEAEDAAFLANLTDDTLGSYYQRRRRRVRDDVMKNEPAVILTISVAMLQRAEREMNARNLDRHRP